MNRQDGRQETDLRAVTITTGFIKHAEGSVLIEVGDTKVICTASIEEKVPPFLKGKGEGWITAEYSMLPRATQDRTARESTRGKVGGRTYEIQRLIGRALRGVIDLRGLGERTVWIDCDVIQADGGTRTASITGAFVALVLALGKLVASGSLAALPVKDYLAAISVGIVDGNLLLDLAYCEDSRAHVDMNIVATGSGELVEVQGTGEGGSFSQKQMNELMTLAQDGISELIKKQRSALGGLADLLEKNRGRQA